MAEFSFYKHCCSTRRAFFGHNNALVDDFAKYGGARARQYHAQIDEDYKSSRYGRSSRLGLGIVSCSITEAAIVVLGSRLVELKSTLSSRIVSALHGSLFLFSLL